ncbi:hypothetical protein DL1_02780 [Thioclava dalianensis]|uniref:Uncharacterized protein n=1 Tax=Thioclava dalianensis TaxID=1185766 RepID=A0A074THY9_9RHOB|nr:hypothetical protein [Thioclava dalianensis]KEP69755.1 hypothetical protein DL1_02780 [Thioclava dalianensis]SFM94309.1 hypothetical protein SAMN05216224_1011051 [Thioclava dalianensis]
MLELTRIHAGRWEASSKQHDAPALEVLHQGDVLDGLEVTGTPGDWQIVQPIPPELISDGVMSFVVRARDSEQEVARFSLIAGEPLAPDLRAELDLLRAELDLLKAAFRRHCAETAG